MAGSGKKLSMQLDGKSAAVVFDSADVDSAVEGVVESSFIHRQVLIITRAVLRLEWLFDGIWNTR